MDQVQLGDGAVRWQMPRTLDRMQIVEYTFRDEGVRARMMALAAGLPPKVLADMGLPHRPSVAADGLIDACLLRQGCTLEHVLRAALDAWQEVWDWYVEASNIEEARGNSGAPNGATAPEPDPTLTTLTTSELSGGPSSA